MSTSSSTSTSAVRTMKTRLSTILNNGESTKPNRIFFPKPLSATNVHQNGSKSHSPKSSKIRRPSSPPVVFHAIAPAPPVLSTTTTNGEQKATNDPESETNRRIANILAHSQIKTMTTEVSSSTDDDDDDDDDDDVGGDPPGNDRRRSSSFDTDADESDDENLQTNKSTCKLRRVLKNRKTSFSSINPTHGTHSTPPTSKNLVRKDDESSNDEQNHDLNSNVEEIFFVHRRLNKNTLMKRSERQIATTTTTDDDSSRNAAARQRYHPLVNLETNGRHLPSESNCSSPISPIVSSTRKTARFQVKPIRKSQQQQILLANAIAAKSSNDDDSTISNQRTKFPLKPSLIERKHTNTPTTDGENGTTNTDQIVNGALTALKKVENGHGSGSDLGHPRVRFHIAQNRKQESAAEEDKSSILTASATTTPAPVSSAASAPGEDEEEEEAVAKSPDNRFIKYAKEIGRGAFKTVYRGLDTEANVPVAWCELQDFAQFDKHERARFKEEAEMLKKLKYQHIVRFFDFWEETNPRTNKKVIILVTELMTSGSLKGYIRNFRGQKEEKRINLMKKWCRQILKGLNYLHTRNPPVIHRDLKCDNVFISSATGCVKIGDLGLATFKTQTFAKSMRGTMEFMAPEMFDEKYDELVDIYSFGLCMLEMITDEYPYIECKGPTAVIKRVTTGSKPDCYFKVESEDAREVIDCCIRMKKEERLSAHDLLQHSFFLDDNGLRIDFVRDSSNDSSVLVKNDTIDFKLKIVDKAKRKNLHAEHKVTSNVFEAILFHYNLKTDTPDQIAEELMAKNYIFEDDKNFVIQSIKDRLRAYRYEQLDRQAGVFGRDGKTSLNPPSQPTTTLLPTPVVSQPLPPATPAPSIPPAAAAAATVPPPQTTPAQQIVNVPAPSITTVINSTIPIDSTPMTKLSNDVPPVKPVISTEPNPINQLTELPTTIPGSAGSLESLEAALKMAFTKTNVPSNTNPTSTVVNEPSETPTTLINQDDSSLISKQENNSYPTVFDPTQVNNEVPSASSVPLNSEIVPSTILQTQSQPTTMLTNPQILQNSLQLPQPSQSFSYSTPSQQQQLVVNNSLLTNDSLKQAINSSLSSTTETIENPSNSISPSATPSTVAHLTDTIQSESPPQVSGSLEQLEVLLKKTFNKQLKTAGTAHSSDGEAANVNSSSIPPTTNEEKLEFEPTSADVTNSTVDSFICHSSIPTSKVTPVLTESSTFDPLISTESGSLKDLENLLQSTFHKGPTGVASVVSNVAEEQQLPTKISTQTSLTTNDELVDLKSMILNLSRTLLTKMNVIESKIDEHCQQTRRINNLLTNTVLPSIVDITDIISETLPRPVDERIQTKLERIQTGIRLTQQSSPSAIETKDLMDL